MSSPVSTFAVEALQRANAILREQVEELTETVRQLRQAQEDAVADLPDWLPRMSSTERRFLAAMRSGRVVSKDAFMTLIYGHLVAPPSAVIVNVYIYKLRRKLVDTRVTIETLWADGYRLTPESIDLLWPSAKSEAA